MYVCSLHRFAELCAHTATISHDFDISCFWRCWNFEPSSQWRWWRLCSYAFPTGRSLCSISARSATILRNFLPILLSCQLAFRIFVLYVNCQSELFSLGWQWKMSAHFPVHCGLINIGSVNVHVSTNCYSINIFPLPAHYSTLFLYVTVCCLRYCHMLLKFYTRLTVSRPQWQ